MSTAAPKMAVNFGDESIHFVKWSKALRALEKALETLNLKDRSAECTLSNRGSVLVLTDPEGVEVWTLDVGEKAKVTK